MNTSNLILEFYFNDIHFFMFISSILLLLSLFLNTYVIILLLSPGFGEFDAAEVFILNQTVSEILFAIMGPFGCLSIYFGLSSYKILGLVFGFCFCARPVFQCCVCLERYLAVVHPVTFLRYKPLKYRVAHCFMACTFILAIGIFCTIIYPQRPFGFFAALYMLILSVDIFCCMSILKKLRHPGPGNREHGGREMNSFKKKAFQVVSMNLLMFCTQILPIVITFGVQNKLHPSDFSKVVATGLTVTTITGFVQPIFILHKAGKLQILRSVCHICAASAVPPEADIS